MAGRAPRVTAKIRGATPEARQEARRKRAVARRARFFRALLAQAASPRRQVEIVGDYLAAIADDLPTGEVAGLAREVAQVADRWSARWQ